MQGMVCIRGEGASTCTILCAIIKLRGVTTKLKYNDFVFVDHACLFY